VSYCINPKCPHPDDIPGAREPQCPHCGSKLLLNNRYRVVGLLGSGGFGKTFEAEDGANRVVIKVLYRNHPKAVTLFQQEAKVLCRLNSPGIPRVEEDGYFVYWAQGLKVPLHCLAMEKIEGENLLEWLDRRNREPISAKLAQNWLEQLVEILEEVHQQHYFHRDIKPHNIMLRSNGQLVLIDFGTAREVTGTYLNKVGGGQNVTEIISAGYTPPEQINGKAVPQSDFYALGRTFVYLMTGRKPTEFSENPRTGKLLWREAASQIPDYFADVIDYMMAPFPGNRPQRGLTILQSLREAAAAAGQAGARGLTNAQFASAPPTTQRSRPNGRNGRSASGFRTGSDFRNTGMRLKSRQRWDWRSFIDRIELPTPDWGKLAQATLLLLLLSQGYAYWRYGFAPVNPVRLVAELPDNLFFDHLLARHVGYVRSLALSPDGKTLVSGSFGVIRVWDLNKRELVFTRSGHSDWVEALVFVNNDTVASASGDKDKTIRFWNLQSGVRQLTLKGHQGGINALVLSPDRQTLISGSNDRTIYLWNLATSKTRLILKGHETAVTALAISPNGQLLASGGSNGMIRLWDLQRGVQLRALRGHTGRVLSLAFAPDNKTIASSSSDQSVRLWNIFPGEVTQTFTDLGAPVSTLAYVEDGQQLIGAGRSIWVWNVKTGDRLHSLWGHRQPITALVSNPSGSLIVTGSADATLKLWHLPEFVPPKPSSTPPR